MGADLFVHNVQYSQVDATASNQADLNVLVEDLLADSAVLTDSNSVGAWATGNGSLNFIDVADATTFDSLVAVQSVQYAEGTQSATTGAPGDGANLLVSVATLNSGGVIADSSSPPGTAAYIQRPSATTAIASSRSMATVWRER